MRPLCYTTRTLTGLYSTGCPNVAFGHRGLAAVYILLTYVLPIMVEIIDARPERQLDQIFPRSQRMISMSSPFTA